MTNDELRDIISKDLARSNAAQIDALKNLGWECAIDESGKWSFIKFIDGEKYIARVVPQGFEVSVGERKDFMQA